MEAKENIWKLSPATFHTMAVHSKHICQASKQIKIIMTVGHIDTVLQMRIRIGFSEVRLGVTCQISVSFWAQSKHMTLEDLECSTQVVWGTFMVYFCLFEASRHSHY